MRNSATSCQLVVTRGRYHAISLGKSSAHVIRYCVNARYAHVITNISSRLPRSWKRPGWSPGGRVDSGAVDGRFAWLATVLRRRHAAHAVANANAQSAWPMPTRSPNVVENQRGDSDMIQSTPANVTVPA